MFSFLYPFANFFQPGIFWPQLDAFKPMLLLSVIGLLIILGMGGRKRMLRLPALILVAVAAIGLQSTLRSENQGSNYTAEDGQSSPLELWRATVKLIEDKPIPGICSGLFYENAQFYGSISPDNRGKNTHITFQEILTGTGLVGFLLFVAMASTLLRRAHRAAAPAPPEPPALLADELPASNAYLQYQGPCMETHQYGRRAWIEARYAALPCLTRSHAYGIARND